MDEQTTTHHPATTDTCALCDIVQAVSRLEWWTDTTELSEPFDTPVLVCRDTHGCATRARLRIARASETGPQRF